MVINYRKNELEEQMLLNLHKKEWAHSLQLRPFDDHLHANERSIKVLTASPYFPLCSRAQIKLMLDLTEAYNKRILEEAKAPLPTEQQGTKTGLFSNRFTIAFTCVRVAIQHVGKLDPRKHLDQTAQEMMEVNIDQCLTMMLSTVTF